MQLSVFRKHLPSPSIAAQDQLQKRAVYKRAGIWEVWPVYPKDRADIVYTVNAGRGYGKPAIHETQETLAPGLFSALLLDWGRVFLNLAVWPSPFTPKDFQ